MKTRPSNKRSANDKPAIYNKRAKRHRKEFAHDHDKRKKEFPPHKNPDNACPAIISQYFKREVKASGNPCYHVTENDLNKLTIFLEQTSQPLTLATIAHLLRCTSLLITDAPVAKIESLLTITMQHLRNIHLDDISISEITQIGFIINSIGRLISAGNLSHFVSDEENKKNIFILIKAFSESSDDMGLQANSYHGMHHGIADYFSFMKNNMTPEEHIQLQSIILEMYNRLLSRTPTNHDAFQCITSITRYLKIGIFFRVDSHSTLPFKEKDQEIKHILLRWMQILNHVEENIHFIPLNIARLIKNIGGLARSNILNDELLITAQSLINTLIFRIVQFHFDEKTKSRQRIQEFNRKRVYLDLLSGLGQLAALNFSLPNENALIEIVTPKLLKLTDGAVDLNSIKRAMKALHRLISYGSNVTYKRNWPYFERASLHFLNHAASLTPRLDLVSIIHSLAMLTSQGVIKRLSTDEYPHGENNILIVLGKLNEMTLTLDDISALFSDIALLIRQELLTHIQPTDRQKIMGPIISALWDQHLAITSKQPMEEASQNMLAHYNEVKCFIEDDEKLSPVMRTMPNETSRQFATIFRRHVNNNRIYVDDIIQCVFIGDMKLLQWMIEQISPRGFLHLATDNSNLLKKTILEAPIIQLNEAIACWIRTTGIHRNFNLLGKIRTYIVQRQDQGLAEESSWLKEIIQQLYIAVSTDTRFPNDKKTWEERQSVKNDLKKAYALRRFPHKRRFFWFLTVITL